MPAPSSTTYRLVPPAAPSGAPRLDAEQQRVVDHPGGPLLVLAGPGTGKTTTLVEAIVDRIEHRGARPEEVLALTFSRKAAEQLRDRVTARLGRTMATSLSSTFHSFAYGLVRRYAPAQMYAGPLRLLSAPEQDVILRELLTPHPESVHWPDSFRAALDTRGFAREVNAVLSRAREKGLDADELRGLGEGEDLPAFRAAGLFLEQYLTTLDDLGATDYADLIRRATIEAAEHRDELRAQWRYVFVDEYQDTDPGQVALLRQLAGDGRDLVVVGDPNQSIYAFRGAEVRGILDFPTEFPRVDGSRADVIALGTTRRFGRRIQVASRRVAGRLSLSGSIPEAARGVFLDPACEPSGVGDGRVQVRTFDTDRSEAEHLADLLRRAHLEDGVAWGDMAVLVRSGRSTLPPLRRALGAAGVPVEVARDEIPLVRDPAVLPLLDAVRAVVHLDDGPDHPDHLDAARAQGLLLGPLGGLDAGDLRRLGRRLRARAKEQVDGAEPGAPASSRELLRRAVVDLALVEQLSTRPAEGTQATTGHVPSEPIEVTKALALARLLARTRGLVDAGASAEEVLWALWAGTEWPERLRRAAEAGGPGARRAHRDLDAVCGLFDAVSRAEEQRVHVGVAGLFEQLTAQQIPADSLAEQGARGDAVRVMTAHRSKGLEWGLVVVAHVQADAWPDLRRRATLLGADRIGPGELLPPVTAREQLLEERRLFYVACTRARERLVVTAVRSPDDDGEQPSRFLDELGVTDTAHVVGRPPRPLSLGGLVAELRRTVSDPATPEPLRRAAARRLARLAAEPAPGAAGARGARLVPLADPAHWWGTREPSRSSVPLRDPERPVPVSASVVVGMGACPLQWFLQREAGGTSRTHQAANLGQVLHALAERVATGEIDAGVDDVDVLMAHVDAVWERMEFRTPWSKAREYERVRAALARFLRWHHGNQRRLLGTEQHFSAEVEVLDERGAPVPVRLTGYADRVELDADGAVIVVDLKTGRNRPSNRSVESDPQLGLYQLAVEAGAVDALAQGAPAGGAELVQVGALDDSEHAVVQPQPAAAPDGPQRRALGQRIAVAAGHLRAETFPATKGDHCRDCAFVSSCPVMGAGSVTGR
ncbi:ATP-dependent DNA helicase [Nocardioides sp. R-C-SC26]|uniref:ATP-dependent helicase n=1 Tax=Nocardioides sp. R-C-SC26 TaxID=2870414 RepID=UPI001E3707E7|nr:ATP-dependent DNA helicase [Nocardioides sp. R-C-SC26]